MAFGSPATVPFQCNSHDASGMHYAVIGFVCVRVCVWMCVFIFVVFGFILISFWGYLLIIQDRLEHYFSGFWLPFIRYLAIWRVSGPPWARWGPIGRQGVPKKGPRSEKLVRWTPPGLPVQVHFWIIFAIVSIKKRIQKSSDYSISLWRPTAPKCHPESFQNPSTNEKTCSSKNRTALMRDTNFGWCWPPNMASKSNQK